MTQHTSLQLLETLVGFPTVSCDSNLKLIGFIEDYLSEHGVPSTLFVNADKTKANLFARIGPAPDESSQKHGIILSGHTDVVPVKGQNWSQDPFTLHRQGGRVFGRGTCDMKAFIAIALAKAPAMVAAKLKEPIYLAFSYDEETGCTGVKDMVAHIANMEIRPRVCIVGEPTLMSVINAHKGIRSYKTTITGLAAHSSAPHLGANAIVAAAELITYLGKASEDAKSFTDHRFTPPFTSFNIGLISGGLATNIIAEKAEFIWEFRPIPGFDGDKVVKSFEQFATQTVLQKLQQTAPQASIITREQSNAPPLLSTDGSDAETFVMNLIGTNELKTAAYATEAGHFQQTGDVSTVVCGPGSIDQAHKPDEFIDISEIERCERFMDKLIKALS
jgi:acetylornithine deacetylase